MATSTIILGQDIDTQQKITLPQDERLGGTYVIGKTGSGKTTLLVNMILQDIEQGMGVCFFDTHGDALLDILRRFPATRDERDVILLDLLDTEYAFGLNLFQCTNPQDKEEVSRISSTIMDVFAKLFTESGDLFKEAPNMAETLQNVIPVLIAHQHPRMTMAEIPLLVSDEDARAKLLQPLKNQQVRLFWNMYNRWRHDRQDELTSSTRRRVSNFLIDSLILEIVGQSETTIDFRQIMDEGKILLVKLSRKHPLLTSLVGSVIVSQIANAAYSREDTPEDQRRQFNLYADEYQRFSTPTFAELLAEVRKYKIATVVAHQFRDQLDHANRGATLNARNLIVYEVSGKDADELAVQFDATPPEPEMEIEEEPWGDEEIKTPVRDVVSYLLSTHGSHPSPEVNEFASVRLQTFAAWNKHYPGIINLLNKLFYNAMEGKDTSSTTLTFNDFAPLLPILDYSIYFSFDSNEAQQAFMGYWDTESENARCTMGTYMREKIRNRYLEDLHEVFYHLDQWAINFMENDVRQTKMGRTYAKDGFYVVELEDIIARLKESWEGSRHDPSFYPSKVVPTWFTIDLDKLQWRPMAVSINLTTMAVGAHAWVMEKGQEENFYSEADLERAVEEELHNPLDSLAAEITELKDVMRALADDPIHTGSGLYRPVIRQIKRKPPQKTHNEMWNSIANHLASPQRYTAQAKLGTEEFTIKALPFRKADDTSVVADRVKRIQANTRQNYCKKRTDVDMEIEERQAELITTGKPISRIRHEGEEE